MAQIPTDLLFGASVKESTGSVSAAVDARVAAAPYEAAKGLATAAMKLGEQQMALETDLDRMRKFSEITSEYNRAQTDLSTKMLEHRDDKTYMASWQEQNKEIRNHAIGRAREDAAIYKAVVQSVDQAEKTLYTEHKGRSRNLLVDNSKASYAERQQAAAYASRSETSARQQQLEMLKLTNAYEATGYFTASEAVQARQQNRKMILGSLAAYLMEHDTDEFDRLYDQGAAGIFGGLTPDELLSVGKEALSLRWAREDRDEKNLNKWYDRQYALVTSAIWDGKITKEDLDRLLSMRLIRNEHYDDLLLQLSREEKGDRSVYDRFRAMLYDPQQTHRVTFKSVRESTMPNGFKAKMLKELEEYREKKTRFGDGHSEALNRIKAFVAPSFLTLNPKQEEAYGYVAASRVFLDWENKNPHATAYEMMQKADEIGRQYLAGNIKSPEAAKATGKNPYLEGVKDKETLKAAKEKLGREYRADQKKGPYPGQGGQYWLHKPKQYEDWLEELDRWENN